MSWLTGVGQRVRELLRPSGLDADLDAELQQHFDHEINRQLASGVPEDEARRRARPSPRSEAAASWPMRRAMRASPFARCGAIPASPRRS